MHIIHSNLARGFRGGERQTLLLIDALAQQYPEIKQSLIALDQSPLLERAQRISSLTCVPLKKSNPLSLLHLFRKQSPASGDVIHAHDAKACHLAYWLGNYFNKPYLITRRMDRAPSKRFMTRKVYRNCNHLVSLSHAIERIVLNDYPKLNHSVIPSMCASLPFETDAVKRIRDQYPEKLLIGHVGALVEKHKGQQYLLEAARQLQSSHPKAHFLLLGEGSDEDSLKHQAKDLNNVSFLGFQRNVGDYYRAFDLFVFPSLQEGLGSSLLDAMDAQLPIIASDVGGIPDLIHPRENGLLVPVGDADALAKTMVELIENPALAKQLAQQAKYDVGDYHPLVLCRSYRNLYDSLVCET